MADSHVRIVFRNGRPVGCAAVWDQRAVRQTVVNAYGPRLGRLRWAVNLWSNLTGRGVPLPPAHRAISQAFVSHVCLPADDPALLGPLVLSLSASAQTIGVDVMTLGLDARDPRLPHLVRRFHPHVYRTKIYTVDWPDAPRSEPTDGRLLGPEVATL